MRHGLGKKEARKAVGVSVRGNSRKHLYAGQEYQFGSLFYFEFKAWIHRENERIGSIRGENAALSFLIPSFKGSTCRRLLLPKR